MLTVVGWKTFLAIFGYSDFLAGVVTVWLYIKCKKKNEKDLKEFRGVQTGFAILLILQALFFCICILG